ncbi:phage holin family protein [Nocardia sp. CNY236]|uniref:phage holin family protein n=1 Tax=Nocardia sp. CNY236 TaxID=1169152 RepID=UPI00040BD465|nr:phage holin family protein [Nocardia sp. CNY236]
MSFNHRGTRDDAERGRTVTSIPLTDTDPLASASFGALVSDAAEQVSTLVRAEIELAKTEVSGQIRKGLQGSVLFIAAGTVLLFSTFFLFFALAELLDVWLWRWLAFFIVFIMMVAAAAVSGFLGFLRVKNLRAPEKTIDSLKQATTVFPRAGGVTMSENRATLDKSTS